MTSSTMSKKTSLFQTLRHESLANVVKNLISKVSIAFAEIHNKGITIAQNREISVPEHVTFNNRNGQKTPASRKPLTKDPSTESSFSKTDGNYFKRQLIKECNKRKKARQEAKQNLANVRENTTNHFSSYLD